MCTSDSFRDSLDFGLIAVETDGSASTADGVTDDRLVLDDGGPEVWISDSAAT